MANFNEMKHRWLTRLMRDPSLTPATRLVGFEVFKHLNPVSRDAWPSQETIRRNLGLGNVRTVRRAIQDLSRADYIAVTFDPGSRSNTYAPVFTAADEGRSAPIDEGRNAPIDRGNPVRPMRTFTTADEGRIAPLNTLKEIYQEKSARPRSITEAIDQHIARFEGAEVDTDGQPQQRCALDHRWQPMKRWLCELRGRDLIDSWLPNVTLDAESDNALTLSAPTNFIRSEVETRFAADIVSAHRACFPDSTVVKASVRLRRAVVREAAQ